MSTVVRRETTVHEFPRRADVAPVAAKSQLFFNREFSLLEFHARVLEEALDDRNPLVERLKFLAIFSSNLDEFFMIRVSGLKEELDDANIVSADGLRPAEHGVAGGGGNVAASASVRSRSGDLVSKQGHRTCRAAFLSTGRGRTVLHASATRGARARGTRPCRPARG